MTGKAHKDDVLIALNLIEARTYPQFQDRQVITMSNLSRVRGRTIRNVYFTSNARLHPKWTELCETITHLCEFIFPVRLWEPPQTNVVEQIKSLPAQNTSKSRDFGRGYTKAIKDVLGLLVDVSEGV